jgi:hypothetical protein
MSSAARWRARSLAVGAAVALIAPQPSNAQAQLAELARVPPVQTGLGQVLAIVSGDIDGDHDVDLLVSNFGGHRLLTNDGRGVFRDGTAALPALPVPEVAEFVDADHDGDLDLVWLAADRDLLMINDGRGTFGVAPLGWMPIVIQQARRAKILVGDVDNDGDTDLLLVPAATNHPPPPSTLRLYLGDGAGFVDATAGRLPTPLIAIQDAAIADFDGDHDLDAVVIEAITRRVLIYENDGRGRFVERLGRVPTSGTGYYGVARTRRRERAWTGCS